MPRERGLLAEVPWVGNQSRANGNTSLPPNVKEPVGKDRRHGHGHLWPLSPPRLKDWRERGTEGVSCQPDGIRA